LSRIFLVRHGNTRANSTERFWGRTDVELSAHGLKQAEQLRDRLSSEKIDTIYTSNLRRASITAGIIASHHEAEIITCPELQEINFGKVEGLTFTEINQRYPELVDTWLSREPGFRFPEGESVGEFNKRVTKFLGILTKHTTEESILIVAHSGTLRLLICNLLGIEPRYWRQFRVDLASLSMLETYHQGAILNSINDVSHLK